MSTSAPIELRRALQKQVLKATAKRVIDIFNSWDEDGDGIITKREFRKAIIPLLNIPAQPGDFDALFDMFDSDGSGEITIQELNQALRRGQGVELDSALRAGAKGKIRTEAKTRIALRKVAAERGSRLGNVDLKQLGADGVPEERRKADAVSELITRALSKQRARVIDLFHEWDEDGDGLVSRAEFYKALPLLGVDASRKEAESLFNSWDPDESGSITFQELTRALRPAHASDNGRAKPPELMPALHFVSPSPHLYFARLVSQQFVPPHPWLGASHPAAASRTTGTGTGGAPPSSTPRAAWQGSPGYSLRSAARDGGGAAAAAAAAAIEGAMPTPLVAAAEDDEDEYEPRVSLTMGGPDDAPVASLTIEVVSSSSAADDAAAVTRQPQAPQRKRPAPQQRPFRVLARPPGTAPPPPPRPVTAAARTRSTATTTSSSSTEPAPRVSIAVGGSDEAPLVSLTVDVVVAARAAAARPRPVSTPAPRRAADGSGDGDGDGPWGATIDLADLSSMPPLTPKPPPPLRATASSLTMRPCEAEMAWRSDWPASPNPRPSTAGGGGGGGGGRRELPRAVTRLNRPEAPNHGVPEYGRPQKVVGEAAPTSPQPQPKPPPSPSPSPYAPTPTPAAPPATPPPRSASPPRPSLVARPPGKGGRPFPRVNAPPPSPRRRGPRKTGTINNLEHLTAYRLNPELRLVQKAYT